MTTIDRTAYPRFRATLTPTQLHDHFTPTAKELALAEAHTRDEVARLTFEYAGLRQQLLPWEQCEPQVADYCLQLDLPPDSKTLVETLRAELTSLAEQNDPIEMEKRVKFNQLVANCVMLQNVLDMSQALRELIEEGYPVSIKAVQRLSAYPHGHVQRYGEYDMDINEIPLRLLRLP